MDKISSAQKVAELDAVSSSTSEQLRAEIQDTLGFIPSLFASTTHTPQIFGNLWQQTLSAYINNPLPTAFKEKLSAYLSRFCAVPYCMICHSCSLYELGVEARDILALLESPPPIEPDISHHLLILSTQLNELKSWSELTPTLEASLLACATFIALESENTEPYRTQLRRVLGETNYHFLIVFIAYIKTCHIWMEAHPEVNYLSDRRVQDHFENLVVDEPELLDFFDTYWRQVKQEQETWSEQQATIAERRQNELVLRQVAEEKLYLARAVASTTESIVITDPNRLDNPIIYVNPAFTRITGYDAQDAIGRNCRFLQGADTNRQVVDQIRAAIAEQREIKITILNYRKDGQPFWNELKIAPVLSEARELLYFVGIAEDITDRVRGEEERRQSEQKIREQAALLDVTTDAIFVQDLSRKILFWNPGAERLYGYSSTEAFGRDATALLHPEKAIQLEQAQKTVLEQGQWHSELNLIHRSGKKLIVESRWTFVKDEHHNPKFILVVSTDITEKKQLEAQFLHAQRMESIGTLASGITHDLNNILTPILAAAQLLLIKTSRDDVKQRQLLDMIQTSANRGADLIKQVLSFARGIEGKRSLLQVRHLIAEIRQIIQETFPKAIDVHLDLASDLWLVTGDATHLHQVLMNLCVNARDAMPEGGTLSLIAENLWIDEPYARMNLDAQVGSYIVVTVADTGTGIAPEALDRIFEPFFTTKELGKGTGLGLSTVLGIIKGHGGFITVTSTIAEGTQFKVYLPAMKSEEPPLTQVEAFAIGQGELILVVDDEANIREISQTVLETYQYHVLTAIDGIDAIAQYADHKREINLVLIDLMMPVMDGATTIRALRKLNPQVKIVAVSGLVPSAQMPAIGSEIQAFLPKPYTAKELLTCIQSVLK